MDLAPILKQIYPAGSIGPGEDDYQGECISFAHAVLDFASIGDTFQEKKHFIESNGTGSGRDDYECYTAANIGEIARGFRIGDLVITSNGVDSHGKGPGHGFIVANLDHQNLYAAEANFHLDLKVTYNRVVAKNDPKIVGIIRAPFKLDLGQCAFNYDVLINNQKWQTGFLTDVQKEVLQWTNNKLLLNFYPLLTQCNNWWYDTQQNPIDREFYKIISRGYFDSTILPLSFTNHNQPPDALAFIVRPDQWQGAAFGAQALTEIGWCYSDSKPCGIQIASAEFDMSPWYYGMRLVTHGLIHELGHRVNWLNGMNDDTHNFDNPVAKNLQQVFSKIDFNRIIANL